MRCAYVMTKQFMGLPHGNWITSTATFPAAEYHYMRPVMKLSLPLMLFQRLSFISTIWRHVTVMKKDCPMKTWSIFKSCKMDCDAKTGDTQSQKGSLQEMDQHTLESKLRRQGITRHFNPPTASKMGAVFERAIRSTRNILAGLLSDRKRISFSAMRGWSHP